MATELVLQSIEDQIIKALCNVKKKSDAQSGLAKSQNNGEQFSSSKKDSVSELEDLLDVDSKGFSEDSVDSNLTLSKSFTDGVDYSQLLEDFNFEQLSYVANNFSYLSVAVESHDAKYREWEEEVTYVMVESETMDEEEAQDTIQEVIYSAVLGGAELDFDKRRRLDNWIKFNPALFSLYKSTSAVRSDDVNYAV